MYSSDILETTSPQRRRRYDPQFKADLVARCQQRGIPAPGPEHSPSIAQGILRDMERAWNIPHGALTLSPSDMLPLIGLAPREMKQALLDHFGKEGDETRYMLH